MNELEALQTACECCEGISQATPAAIENRPGLSALGYRVGTHGRFKASMVAGLSTSPALRDITTRRDDDPTVALLDGWATVLDVLTFYQERIANESYLRTAVERRSLLELARAIGYELSPGVAASTHLAFTVDDSPGSPPETVIPAGTRAQSIPGPGEMPQSFETSGEIRARALWNAMPLRTTRPQVLKTGFHKLVFSGTGLDLKAGDLLLAVFGFNSEVLRITAVSEEIPPPASADAPRTVVGVVLAVNTGKRMKVEYFSDWILWVISLLVKFTRVTSLLWWLQDFLSNVTPDEIAAFLHATGADERELQAWLDSNRPHCFTYSSLKIYAFRVRAKFFGHNAQPWECLPKEWREKDAIYSKNWDQRGFGDIFKNSQGIPFPLPKLPKGVEYCFLDQSYQEILPGSFVVVEDALGAVHAAIALVAKELTHADYGLSSKSTGLVIYPSPTPTASKEVVEATPQAPKYFSLKKSFPSVKASASSGYDGSFSPGFNNLFSTDKTSEPDRPRFHFRTAIAWAASEELPLSDVPWEAPVSRIEMILDGFALGLMPGKVVVVSGEPVFQAGVISTEVRVLREVKHNFLSWATHLSFTEPLENSYTRATVRIQANVASATHGEACVQVLGSGDASIPFQSFRLQYNPLTHVPSPNGRGGESTLEVRVNGVLWHEVPDLYRLGSEDRSYVLRRDDDGNTRVLFGDGVHGACLPSGSENVTASYRTGLGLGGHLDAGRISLLASRPLGVMDVVNPVPAAGAGNPESRDEARRNAPLRVLTLDRIVSLDDFQNFARAFAGVGKARADWLWDGLRRVVHLTVTGADARPLAAKAPLLATLHAAMDGLRDPFQPLVISPARLLLFRIQAALKLHPDHLPATVFAAVEESLREAFSYEARDLGEPVVPSRVVTLIQSVAGVVAVDLDPLAFEPPESGTIQNGQLLAMPARLGDAPAGGGERPILGAQLLILAPRGIRLETMA